MSGADLSFTSIIGQEKAKELLTRSVSRAKMSHAYLFRGPAGVGKKRTALAFAASINCSAPHAHSACGSCPSCHKFLSGNHPDFHVIRPEGAAIKISQVRELKHTLTFPPFEAACRVALLTDIHTMRREAANSLLKTLEEPPENTLLLLTGDEANDILPTITSRCQVIPFFNLPYDRVAERLIADGNTSAEEAATLAAVSEGSLGRARTLKEKGLLAMRQELVNQLVRHRAGQPEAVEVVFDFADRAAKLKEDLDELLELLKIWLKDLVLLASGIPDRIINQDLAPTYDAVTGRWNLEQLSAKLRAINRAQQQLDRNCNRALVCEVLFFALL